MADLQRLTLALNNKQAAFLFKSYCSLNGLSHNDIATSETEEDEHHVEVHYAPSDSIGALRKILSGQLQLLNKLRTIKDYQTILNYPQQHNAFFLKVYETHLPPQLTNIVLAKNGKQLVSNERTFRISLSHTIKVQQEWVSGSFRTIQLSNNGDYAILRNKRGYYLRTNTTSTLIYLDTLDPKTLFTFIFNTGDKNFASVDNEGNFTYISIIGQPLIKLKLHIDSYLDLKMIYLSKYIITEQAIYNFSGDVIYSSHQKYVFHHIDDQVLIRENFFTQKIEVLNQSGTIVSSYNSHNDRLIHNVLLAEKYLIVNYEDELLQFINTESGESFSAFTKERVRSLGVLENQVTLLLSDNTLQIIELKK